ncbi:MAG: hypothetical protein FJZ80_01800 [Bacteroidetes bacterium]|nr:hypothetical protein [Bacteroidota bacterium]MBM3425199.1 hypothetical protein [Bacteroidota bacterium]
MKLLFYLSLTLLGMNALAQKPQKNPALDSLYPYKKTALLSAMVPGLGQIYNSIHSTKHQHAFWKVPLIYAGLGATTWLLIQNQLTVNSLKTEYNARQTGPPLNPRWMDYDTYALLSLYEQFASLRDVSILGVGAVYLFQILDAAVEAHFLNFSISKDLSLNFTPYGNSLGIGCSAKLTFK